MKHTAVRFLCAFGGCLAGCHVHGRYSVQGPFGVLSWGAEGDKPHKAEVPIELIDALADRIRGTPTTPARQLPEPPAGAGVTPTGSEAVPVP